jgi:hypothetical protein
VAYLWLPQALVGHRMLTTYGNDGSLASGNEKTSMYQDSRERGAMYRKRK